MRPRTVFSILPAVVSLLLSLSSAAEEKPGSPIHDDRKSAPEEWYFAVIGDTTAPVHPVGPVFRRFLDAIGTSPATCLVHVGDFLEPVRPFAVWEARLAEWRACLDARRFPLYPAFGNDEVLSPRHLARLEAAFGPGRRIRRHRDAVFLFLNTEEPGAAGEISADQRDWLRATLAATRDVRRRFLVLHRPLWGTRNWRERIHPLLVEEGVKHVFAGHAHIFGDTTLDGVRYIVTGGGGEPLHVDWARHHWLLVRVGGDSVEIEPHFLPVEPAPAAGPSRLTRLARRLLPLAPSTR